MLIDRPLCDVFWRGYLAQLPREHLHHGAKTDAFGFGGDPALADELAALVLAGQKRATTSLPVEFTSLAEALPRAGDLSIVVWGNGRPAAIIERTHVEARPFDEVDQRYASIEGEGDGSLAQWRQAHSAYFAGVCQRLGGSFDGRTAVLCQVFRVVWPAPDARPQRAASAGAGPEAVVRVGLAGWVGESGDVWDDAPKPVLGTIGDQLYLIEIDDSSRERVLLQLIDRHEGDERRLRVEVALFGGAGGFFASSLNFLASWPESAADLPADIFVDDHHRAAFTRAGDSIAMSVRHALRSSDGPARRSFRFEPAVYEQAIRDLVRESRRLRDELIAMASQRAPHKVESLRAAAKLWPP